ncbi:MAG: hypothetical protein WAN97_07815 [Candidatus Acidiferrales bacterium]
MAILLALGSAALTFVAVLWAAAFGLLAVWFFAAWIADSDKFSKTSNRRLWAMKVAIVLIAALIGYRPIVHFWRIERAEAKEGDLFDGVFQPEDNCMALPVQVGKAGTVFVMVPPKAGQNMPAYFAPFPDAQFLIQCGKRGPLISTTVRDRNGNQVVNIERNHWTVYPPYCSDKNYTKDALEVKDDSGHVLLQIKYAPQERNNMARIQVQGEWWSNEGHGLRIVLAGGAGGEVIPLVPQNQHNDALIKPVFKYPSKDFWGDFAN